jgi:hypothetical protein
MTLEQELSVFYKRNGFGDVPGSRPLTVSVYTGCMLVPMPNIETRRVFLKYHDLHHLITGYSVGRIGEGEVSGWELGTGSAFVSPTLGVMNLIALSTGLVLEPTCMRLLTARRSTPAAGKTSRHFDRRFSRSGAPLSPPCALWSSVFTRLPRS